MSSREGAKSIVDDAVAAFGTVDILVNNAGILRDKSFTKMSIEDFRAVLDVHLMGAMYCTSAVWPIMLVPELAVMLLVRFCSVVFIWLTPCTVLICASCEVSWELSIGLSGS